MDTGAKANVTQLVIFFAGLMLGVGGGYLQGSMKTRTECNVQIKKCNQEIQEANRQIMNQKSMLLECAADFIPKPQTVNPFGR